MLSFFPANQKKPYMQASEKANENNIFLSLKVLPKHRISLIVNLIMDLLDDLQIEKSVSAETDSVFSLG